jgi:hypothetical protein
MYSSLSRCASLGVLAFSLSALPALAHHGWAGNADEEFELTGTVATGVSLAGPHATMKVHLGYHLGPAGPDRAGRLEGRDHSSGRCGYDPWSSQQGPKTPGDQDRTGNLERPHVQRLP